MILGFFSIDGKLRFRIGKSVCRVVIVESLLSSRCNRVVVIEPLLSNRYYRAVVAEPLLSKRRCRIICRAVSRIIVVESFVEPFFNLAKRHSLSSFVS